MSKDIVVMEIMLWYFPSFKYEILLNIELIKLFKFLCVNITPLGLPVEPDVKIK